MLITIVVDQKDLSEVAQFLQSEGMCKPDKHLCYEVCPSRHSYMHSPMSVLVTVDEWTILSDYEDENRQSK
jgi:hypothetical protein